MVRFAVDNGVSDDLKEIQRTDPGGVGRILAVIQEMGSDVELHNLLLTQGAWVGSFNIVRIESLREKGFWRLKTIESEDLFFPYRIIYAFRPVGPFTRSPWIRVMAVLARRDAYDDSHPSIKRAIARYDDL